MRTDSLAQVVPIGEGHLAAQSASTSSTTTASAIIRGSGTVSLTRLSTNLEESARSNAARGSVDFFGLPPSRVELGRVLAQYGIMESNDLARFTVSTGSVSTAD